MSGKQPPQPAQILIVEDDDLMLVFYERFFAKHKEEFVCIPVSSAERALDCLREGRVDAAIIDWDLPGISGIQLLKALRANAGTRTLPVILITGRADADSKALARKHGASAYLSKPFETSRLLSYLRGFCR